MAAKTYPIGANYGGNPLSTNLLGKAYEHQQTDRNSIMEVIEEEHHLVPGTDTEEHGRHLSGSAVIYIGTTAPALRPNGSDSLGELDVGRLWLDTSLATATYPVIVLKVYKEVDATPGTYAWEEVGVLKAWNDYDPDNHLETDKEMLTLRQILNQALLDTSEVAFKKVTVTDAPGFVGDLDGTAYKIRTSAPTSPAAGDIWKG